MPATSIDPTAVRSAHPLDGLRALLAAGRDLTRERAREIVALGADALPALIHVLEDPQAGGDEKRAAARLAGAIGDPSAVPALMSVLAAVPDDDSDVENAAAHALAVLGPRAAEALLEVLDGQPGGDLTSSATETLAKIAVTHPHLRPRAAAAFLGILRDPAASPGTRAEAACALMDVDWRDALPEIERALDRGALGTDVLGPVEVEAWRTDPTKHRARPPADCLAKFAPAWQVAFEDHCALLSRDCHLEAADRTEALGADLLKLRHVAALADWGKVGRNDPCPCGSGRKFKKCHLDSSRIYSRVSAASWVSEGYALLPSEQIERLGEAAVARHLDMLDTPWVHLYDAASSATDDYLLWAVATRFERDDEVAFGRLLAHLAISEQAHPALDYVSLLALALEVGPLTVTDQPTRDRLLDLALRHGDLDAAWRVASVSATFDWERGLALFERIRQAHPRDPWTAVALACAGRGTTSTVVVDALERALAMPGCPGEVLESCRDEHRRLLHEGRLPQPRDTWEWDSPLTDDCRRAMRDLHHGRLDVERSLRLALEDRTRAAPRMLRKPCEPATRQPWRRWTSAAPPWPATSSRDGRRSSTTRLRPCWSPPIPAACPGWFPAPPCRPPAAPPKRCPPRCRSTRGAACTCCVSPETSPPSAPAKPRPKPGWPW